MDEETYFGPHLTIDASECDFKKLTSYELVYDVLNKLPDLIGMAKIELPRVVKWLDPGAQVDGISGFVMIAESHVSVHTFPEKDYVFIDIFSCNPFDLSIAIDFFKRMFNAKKVVTNIVRRGIDFPKEYPALKAQH